jgi:hypothetical protein
VLRPRLHGGPTGPPDGSHDPQLQLAEDAAHGPTYSEDPIVDGRALKPPAPQQFLLNCAAIGNVLAPGASVTFQMHYAVPAALPPGPVEFAWGMDPGGPFDAGTAVQQAAITVVGR